MILLKRISLLLLVLGLFFVTISAESNSEQEYDDDEFTNIVPETGSTLDENVQVAVSGEPEPSALKVQLATKDYSRLAFEFWPEILLLLFTGLYCGIYFQGGSSNEKRAKIWLKSSIAFFNQQFSRLGDERGFFLMKNGADDFIFYGSGRVNCKFMYGHVQLFPRHDIFRMLYTLYEPADDIVEMNFELPVVTPGAVFGIVPRRSANRLRKERFDVNTFTKQCNNSLLPEGFVFLTEHGDVTKHILVDALTTKLAAVKETFEGFVLSDQPRSKPESLTKETHKVLTIKYRLSNPDLLLPLNQLALFLVDHISKLDLRPDVRSKLLRNREEAFSELHKAEQERRQDEVEQRLQEKRRKELEERSQLSPAAQRRLEEKDARRANRKKAAKMTTKVK